MTGEDIIGAVLRATTAITDIVPVDRIKAGLLPEGAALPALVVNDISSVERDTLRRGATVRTTDRVAVTVRAASLRERKLIAELVKNACAGLTGSVGGGSRVSILSAGAGPSLNGPGSSFERTHDFRVSYDATTAGA